MPRRYFMDKNWKKVIEDGYKRSATTAAGWHLKAEELMRAARILHEQMHKDRDDDKIASLVPSYMLLCGYAMENCVKGIAAIRGRLFNEKKKSLEIDNDGHKYLHEYLKDDIFLSDSEIDLLRRLSGYTLGPGRYHIEKKYLYLESRLESPQRIYFAPMDPQMIEEMYGMLVQYLLKLF